MKRRLRAVRFQTEPLPCYAAAVGYNPTMQRVFASVLIVSWALWLGGIGTLFLAATTLFAAFPDDRQIAGTAASAIFRGFDRYQLLLAAVLLLATFGSYVYRRTRLRTFLFCLFAFATLNAVVSAAVITPRIETLRQTGVTATPQFRRLHGSSMLVYVTQAAALLLAGLMLPSVFREPLPEATHGPDR